MTVYQRVALSGPDRVGAFCASCASRVRRRHARAAGARQLVADGDGTSFAARIEKRIPVAAGPRRRQLRCGHGPTARERACAHEPHSGDDSIEAFARTSAPTCRTSSPTARSSARVTAPSCRRSSCLRTTGSSSSSRGTSEKTSTGAVYSGFDVAKRCGRLRRTGAAPPARTRAGSGVHVTSPRCRRTTLHRHRSPRSCPALGAFRADVTGAGPAVYGLFLHGDRARARAAKCVRRRAQLADRTSVVPLIRMAYSQPDDRGGQRRARGSWLRERRIRLALWVAVIEGLLVAVIGRPDEAGRSSSSPRSSLAFYVVAGRNMQLGRRASALVDRRGVARRSRSSCRPRLSSSGSSRSSRS